MSISLRTCNIFIIGSLGIIYHTEYHNTNCKEKNEKKNLTPKHVVKAPIHDYYIKSISNENIGQELLIKYDFLTKQPKYTYEKYTKRNIIEQNAVSKQYSRKGLNFYSDSSIKSDYFKIRPKDYQDSNFDRGHMIPAADMTSDEDLLNATFSMINISPQDPNLNKLYWAKLEAWIRYHYENNNFEEYEVITGPVFAPIFVNGKWIRASDMIGSPPRLIPVPSHFFKVIRGVKYIPFNNNPNDSLEQVVLCCILVPNANIDIKIPLSNFIIRLSNLEALAGLRFFDSLSDNERIRVDKYVPELSNVEKLMASGNPRSKENISIDLLKLSESNPWTQDLPFSKKASRVNSDVDYSPIIHICETISCGKAKLLLP